MKLFKNNILLTYSFLSVLAIVILPAYVYFYLPPQFTELIVENTRNESVRVANHLISMFLKKETNLAASEVLNALKENDEKIRADFHLIKLKLFLPNGEIVYSSNPEDIGSLNKKNYFFDIVAKGKTFPQLVKKDSPSLEGQLMQVDVVETYVPIMNEGVFIGAFEIYFDITSIKGKLDALMTKIYVALLLISGCLLFVIIVSYIKAIKSLAEQKEYERKLHEISITDELTSLLNRRGFMGLAEKQLHIVDRAAEQLFLFYADVDNMKEINDNLGHDIGDQCLIETANLLRSTFRKSDILCRLGGDEFAVLLTCSPKDECPDSIAKRLKSNLEKINEAPGRIYKLQISFGLTKHNAATLCDLKELMTRADNLMYEQKMGKKLSKNVRSL